MGILGDYGQGSYFGGGSQVFTPQGGAGASLQGALAAAGAQQQVAKTQGSTARDVAGIQAEASKYPATLAQQRFNTVWPFVTGTLGPLTNQLAGQAGQAGQGNTAGQPPINASSVYTPDQIQQQVNLMRAGNQQEAASQTRTAQQGLAGRGFGSQSPLAAALQAQYQGQAQQASTQGENQLRYQAAGANAQQMLSAQQAQEGQFASRQREAIQRQQVAAQALSAALSTIGGLA